VLRAFSGAELVELPRKKTRGVCCGAGGSRFWMEEHIGERINVHRSKEIVAQDPARAVTACPFCLVMIRDGVADLGKDETIKTQDIAELVAEALVQA
jgi:Fe-S oxidoreductase